MQIHFRPKIMPFPAMVSLLVKISSTNQFGLGGGADGPLHPPWLRFWLKLSKKFKLEYYIIYQYKGLGATGLFNTADHGTITEVR